MKIVTTSQQLEAAISTLAQASVLAIDTEFMREKTYYPQLCLLQIASGDALYLIDPLPNTLDLHPLATLWSNPAITKVFHAGTQDLKMLFDSCSAAPRPYFDTQDAATLIGQPEQVGYGALVERLLGVKLDKADGFTDWARRPLTNDQLKYAAEDVSYLLKLYPIVIAELESLGRLHWLDEEFDQRSSEDALTIDLDLQYRRLKRVSALKPHQLAVARELASWREAEAMRRDIPKRWLLSDESVLEIARRAPQSTQELSKIRGVGDNLRRSFADIIAAVKKGKSCPQQDWPRLPEKRRITGQDSAAIELMAAVVRKRSAENRLSSSVLGSRAMLEDYLATRSESCPLMQGWRKEVVGDEIKRLLAGKVSLRLQGGKVIVEDYDS
ncbi:MAG: ribonuclease D [Coriobacteriia bacterium]|nr:ribonuclease D [Coriobacteriia bacterium]MCL2537578.1 ribonuclease D [Coriobacteriia bacterium]